MGVEVHVQLAKKCLKRSENRFSGLLTRTVSQGKKSNQKTWKLQSLVSMHQCFGVGRGGLFTHNQCLLSVTTMQAKWLLQYYSRFEQLYFLFLHVIYSMSLSSASLLLIYLTEVLQKRTTGHSERSFSVLLFFVLRETIASVKPVTLDKALIFWRNFWKDKQTHGLQWMHTNGFQKTENGSSVESSVTVFTSADLRFIPPLHITCQLGWLFYRMENSLRICELIQHKGCTLQMIGSVFFFRL